MKIVLVSMILIAGSAMLEAATPAATPAAAPPSPSGNPAPASFPAAVGSPPTTSLYLSIFYDAMEETSQKFLSKGFLEQYTPLAAHLDVTFVPCQFAQNINGDVSCATKGDPTCTANKVHCCANAQVADKTQLARFLACSMTGVDKLADFNACATQNKIDDKKLLGCSNSDEGKNICRYNIAKESPGDRTMMPKCIFRPLNEIHAGDSYEFLDYYMSSACVTDFHSAVCAVFKTIKEPSLPPECNKKMLMGIFYQAMNEASQKWFQSMAKIYDKLANVLVLKFQPCMLAELVSPGKLDCKDPNDPDCIAGKTHACVISLVEDRKVVFEFLKCSMQDTKKLPNFEKCATDNKIPYDKIKSCVDGDLGVKLCYNFGKARPETDSFPAFTYEWDYFPNVSADTATTNDLKYIICYQLKRYSIELRDECQ